MSKKALIILSILGLFLIFLLCAMLHWRAIEKDIADCSNKILQDAGYHSLTITTKDLGRDAIISGTVDSLEKQEKVIKLIKGQCHMANLSDKINIVMPETKIVAKPKPMVKSNAKINLILDNKQKKLSIDGIEPSQNTLNQIAQVLDNQLSDYKSSNSIKQQNNITSFPHANYLQIILPHLSAFNQVAVEINGNTLSIKGDVESQEIKHSIGSQISEALGNNVHFINNLTVIEAKHYQPLDADSCQKVITDKLSESKIHFNSGSAVINQDSIGLLQNLAKITKSCQKVKISVIGHTDNTGNQDKNKVLSQARAAAVVDFLRKAGVRADKLQAFGVGSAQPITSNETIEGRKQNRRIEFKVKSL